MLTKILYVMVCPFTRLLRKIGFMTREAAMAEAERLLEENKWKIDAAIAIERRELEFYRQSVDDDRRALQVYALSIGLPAMDRKEMMN